MSTYPDLDTWVLPRLALQSSATELRRAGQRGNEGLVLWLGVRVARAGHVRAVVHLRGVGVREKPAHVSMTADLMNEVTDLAMGSGLVLVGQIHSHGPYHGLDLSAVDLAEGISFPSYVSVVAPNYGDWDRQLINCGVHVHEGGRFRRLDDDGLNGRFLIRDLPCATFVAGE